MLMGPRWAVKLREAMFVRPVALLRGLDRLGKTFAAR
jgi:hypothetical protein